MNSMLSFLGRQLFVTPQPADPSHYNVQGQVGIVTGSNRGLGFDTAKQLLDLGLSRLILAVRDQGRGDEARSRLLALHTNTEIDISIVDMASYDILNAGVVKFKYEQNKYTGHEETIQINVLATALLASLLLPVIARKKTNVPGKITIVGSEVAEWASFKQRSTTPILPQFDSPKPYDGTERYYVSKLLLEYYLIEAAKRIDRNKIILNVVNPGLCYGSNLHREVPGILSRIFSAFKRSIGRTCEVGARPIVKAAVVEGTSSHGQYYSDDAISKLAPLTRGTEGERLSHQVFMEIMAELKSFDVEEAIDSVATQ